MTTALYDLIEAARVEDALANTRKREQHLRKLDQAIEACMSFMSAFEWSLFGIDFNNPVIHGDFTDDSNFTANFEGKIELYAGNDIDRVTVRLRIRVYEDGTSRLWTNADSNVIRLHYGGGRTTDEGLRYCSVVGMARLVDRCLQDIADQTRKTKNARVQDFDRALMGNAMLTRSHAAALRTCLDDIPNLTALERCEMVQRIAVKRLSRRAYDRRQRRLKAQAAALAVQLHQLAVAYDSYIHDLKEQHDTACEEWAQRWNDILCQPLDHLWRVRYTVAPAARWDADLPDGDIIQELITADDIETMDVDQPGLILTRINRDGSTDRIMIGCFLDAADILPDDSESIYSEQYHRPRWHVYSATGNCYTVHGTPGNPASPTDSKPIFCYEPWVEWIERTAEHMLPYASLSVINSRARSGGDLSLISLDIIADAIYRHLAQES